jgi:hypothetical protein
MTTKAKPYKSNPPEVIEIGPFGPRGAGLEAKFWEFHTQNPDVYQKLRSLALQMRRRGVEQYSIKSLFEVLRWHHALTTNDPSGYKLNNNYTSFYARLLMEREPELEGFFELRSLRWQTYEVN